MSTLFSPSTFPPPLSQPCPPCPSANTKEPLFPEKIFIRVDQVITGSFLHGMYWTQKLVRILRPQYHLDSLHQSLSGHRGILLPIWHLTLLLKLRYLFLLPFILGALAVKICCFLGIYSPTLSNIGVGKDSLDRVANTAGLLIPVFILALLKEIEMSWPNWQFFVVQVLSSKTVPSESKNTLWIAWVTQAAHTTNKQMQKKFQENMVMFESGSNAPWYCVNAAMLPW